MAEGASSNPSNNHRRFVNVTSYVKELGGNKAHVIEKVLIANNGVAGYNDCEQYCRRQ